MCTSHLFSIKNQTTGQTLLCFVDHLCPREQTDYVLVLSLNRQGDTLFIINSCLTTADISVVYLLVFYFSP